MLTGFILLFIFFKFIGRGTIDGTRINVSNNNSNNNNEDDDDDNNNNNNNNNNN